MSFQFNNEYSQLNEAARKDPLASLMENVGDKPLFEHRKELYHWLRTVVSCEDEEELSTARERRTQFWYFEISLFCLETCFRLQEMIKSGELIYSYKQPIKHTEDGTNRS